MPHSNADEERKLDSAGLAVVMMTIVFEGDVVDDDDNDGGCGSWTVVVSYCKLEKSLGTSPLRYSGVEIIRDSSIFPTLSISFCISGGMGGGGEGVEDGSGGED